MSSNVRGGYAKLKRSISPVGNNRDGQLKKVKSDDWRAGSLRDQQDHLLETGLCSDCSFKVGPQDGDTQVFRAHKLMLARASPVFYAMFFGAMPETREEIRIIDVSPQSFKHMLKFIYTEMLMYDVVKDIYDELEDLILAADKYIITALKVAAIKDMETHLHFNVPRLWRCIDLADTLNEPQLRQICAAIFAYRAPYDMESGQFLSLSPANLLAICKQDNLNLESELPLVNACVNWAKNLCGQRNIETSGANIRQCLGNQIIANLRFLSLSPQQFLDGPGAQDWLTKDEKFSIIKGIVSAKKNEEIDGLCGIKEPRQQELDTWT